MMSGDMDLRKQLQATIAARHGVSLSSNDPILMLATASELLAVEFDDKLDTLLRRVLGEFEGIWARQQDLSTEITVKVADDSKQLAQRMVNTTWSAQERLLDAQAAQAAEKFEALAIRAEAAAKATAANGMMMLAAGVAAGLTAGVFGTWLALG